MIKTRSSVLLLYTLFHFIILFSFLWELTCSLCLESLVLPWILLDFCKRKGETKKNENWKIKYGKYSLFACGRHIRKMFLKCSLWIQVFYWVLAQTFWLLTFGRFCSPATQMGLPILMALLVSWNKAIVVCLPHAGFSSSWLIFHFLLYLALILYVSLMNFHPDLYRLWAGLTTLYCLCG